MEDFFKELDGAVGILEDKYNERSRDSNIQQLLPSRGMVARTLDALQNYSPPQPETETSQSMAR